MYHAVSSPECLDAWWTLQCVGKPALNAHYRLYFGPGYDWKAEITQCNPDQFEICIFSDDAGWNGTYVNFMINEDGERTVLDFSHRGWAISNEHYRTSSYCWALYLRLLKNYVETGQVIPYEHRNE